MRGGGAEKNDGSRRTVSGWGGVGGYVVVVVGEGVIDELSHLKETRPRVSIVGPLLGFARRI